MERVAPGLLARLARKSEGAYANTQLKDDAAKRASNPGPPG